MGCCRRLTKRPREWVRNDIKPEVVLESKERWSCANSTIMGIMGRSHEQSVSWLAGRWVRCEYFSSRLLKGLASAV